MPPHGLSKRRTSELDRVIGERIRQRRYRVGMSQDGLAKTISLTYQQVQKYETGSNRVAASVLFTVARALDVPITYFYDGLGATEQAPTAELLTRKQGLLLLGAENMPDDVREAFLGLASAFADEGGGIRRVKG